jgi:hypothetical protein
VCAGSGATTSICCNGICCDGCCDGDGACGACLVFVTSTTYTGALGGLSGADDQCQARAAAGALPGTYTAWLSTGTGANESPASGGFRQSAQPYQLVTGAVVASSWDDLVDPTTDLANPIRWSELTTELPADEMAWTQTTPAGSAGVKVPQDACGTYALTNDCGDWTLADGGGGGGLGVIGLVDCRWTASSLAACEIARHLYCFQQR